MGDAADALGRGDHDAAIRHLNAAVANLTPQSLIRSGITNDDDHIAAKQSMDAVHRHVLKVKDLRDGYTAGPGAGRAGPALANQPNEYDDDGSLFNALKDYLTPDELEVYRVHGQDALMEYLQSKAEAGKLTSRPDPNPAVVSANAYGADPGTAYEYAGGTPGYGSGYPGDAAEFAAARASARVYEDSQPLARRAEDRLAVALGRIGNGTYTPSIQERALGFAAETAPADDIAPVFACSCGAGIGPNHLSDCSSIWTPDDATALLLDAYRATAAAPAADARSRIYESQHSGELMTLTGHMEHLAGQRLRRDSLFEDGQPRPEVAAPHREHVFSDYDDPAARPQPFGWSTRETAAAAAAQMGLATGSAARERDRYAAQRDSAIARQALSRPARLPHPDFGETTRERAQRLKSGVSPVPYGDDPVMGSLPAYAAG